MEIKEIWKNIENYPDYMVSNLGNVKSLWFGKEKILKSRKNKQNYFQVVLYKEGKKKMYLVHRLVATAFIENPENKPQIDHIDTNRQNNIVSNLRWCTHQENCNNPITKINYSKPKSQEHKEKLSIANKGKIFSQEHKDKLSIAHKGLKHTQEHKDKIGKAHQKPILQFNREGTKIIGKYNSATQASKELNIDCGSIGKCCKGKLKVVGGCRWMYLQDYVERMEKLYQMVLKKAS